MVETDDDPLRIDQQWRLFYTRFQRWLTLWAEIDGNAAKDEGAKRDSHNDSRAAEMNDLARAIIATPAYLIYDTGIRTKFRVIDFFIDGEANWIDSRFDFVLAALRADMLSLQAKIN